MPRPKRGSVRGGQCATDRGGRGRGARGNHTNASNGTKPATRSPQKRSVKPSDTRRAKERIGEGEKMYTAMQQVDKRRQEIKQLSDTEYLATPPDCGDLIQARMIISGDHLLPKGLNDAGVFDRICVESQVWITRVEDNETALDISARNVRALQIAVGSINWLLHNMRVSEESVTMQFFIQPTSEASCGTPIIFEPGKRPRFKDDKICLGYPFHALAPLTTQFSKLLSQALQKLPTSRFLKMQITFGYLNVVAKKKALADLVSLEEFERALGQYSSYGRAAILQSQFSGVETADKFLSLILGNKEIVQKGVEITLQHHLEFALDKKTVRAEIRQEDKTSKAILPIWTEVEHCPPLNWVFSAPDMSVDWSLRVDSHLCSQLPESTAKLVESFGFRFNNEDSSAQRDKWKKDGISNEQDNEPSGNDKANCYFKLPKWQASTLGNLGTAPSNFKVKSSALVQFRDTPYEIEVTITQRWAKMPANPEADQLSWSISIHGITWDQALNNPKSGEPSGRFREDLSDIWPGDDSLENRLKEFLGCILSIQTITTELFS